MCSRKQNSWAKENQGQLEEQCWKQYEGKKRVVTGKLYRRENG